MWELKQEQHRERDIPKRKSFIFVWSKFLNLQFLSSMHPHFRFFLLMNCVFGIIRFWRPLIKANVASKVHGSSLLKIIFRADDASWTTLRWHSYNIKETKEAKKCEKNNHRWKWAQIGWKESSKKTCWTCQLMTG